MFEMCSFVEIMNNNEIYIHYLTTEKDHTQKITIVNNGNHINDDNNNSVQNILRSQKNLEYTKNHDKTVENADSVDSASLMGSSLEVKDSKDPPDNTDTNEEVNKETAEGVTREKSDHMTKESVSSKEMSTQVEVEAGPEKTKTSKKRNRSTQVVGRDTSTGQKNGGSGVSAVS